MPLAEKMLLAAGVGRSVYGGWRFQRMLSALAMVVMLAVAAAILMSALAIGGFYAAFLFLVQQGIAVSAAFLFLMLVAAVLVAALLLEIRRWLHKLKSPTGIPVGETVDAFLDGLFTE